MKLRRVKGQLDIKEPSERKKAHYKKFIDRLISLVLSNPPGVRYFNHKRVEIFVKDGCSLPNDWPNTHGRYIRDVEGGKIYSYTADRLLYWMWEHRLTDVNPEILFKKRFMYAVQVEKMLDSLEIKEYNVDYGMEDE